MAGISIGADAAELTMGQWVMVK